MKFTLVRHGEVEAESVSPASTPNDPMLTVYGRRQGAALAMELLKAAESGDEIEALYTAPSRAARMTADALSAALDVGDPIVTTELDASAAEGDTTASEALQDRAWDFLLGLKTQFGQADRVVIVAQDLVIRLLVCKALELPLADMMRFELSPASLTTIEFRLQRDRERILIAALNDTCHVEDI